MYHVAMSDWKIDECHPKFTVIQKKKKTNQENEQPTIRPSKSAHKLGSKFHLGGTKDIITDEDNDTPCYKDYSKLTVPQHSHQRHSFCVLSRVLDIFRKYSEFAK
jgi:hypothetical protein